MTKETKVQKTINDIAKALLKQCAIVAKQEPTELLASLAKAGDLDQDEYNRLVEILVEE